MINQIGERIWLGSLGNALVVLSFVAALLSFIAYLFSSKDIAFKKLASLAFSVHAISVIGIIATLFFMLFNHYFEYQYAFQHSSKTMNMKFIFSCFWEGQEGSFLIWTFWNVLLGLILRYQLKSTEWQIPVMAIFALVQVFLASMILGVYIFDYKIGSNPFLLLREHSDYKNLPFLQIQNYLQKIDGRGLNPLLMNYWMTIHPPTLFLGFASTLVPFVFAIAGLWKKNYTKWQVLALPWTFFGVLILGVGVLMGGAWAYEALSFGGFWAWDPVENSSLVPWLVLVGAGHTMLINKNKGGSLFTTHLLSIASFLLVLYSTFLTRSGVLGSASVHAFTDLGMTGQLVLYVLTFIFISVFLLINDKLIKVSYAVVSILILFFSILYGYKKIILLLWMAANIVLTAYCYKKDFPKQKNEEELYSREFWMFLGSLVLVISALVITYFTSIPVLNKLFATQYAPPKVMFYNDWMLPFAIIIIALVAASQFLKYKKTNVKSFLKSILRPLFLAIAIGLCGAIPLYFIEISGQYSWYHKIGFTLLLIASIFAVFANAAYWAAILKGNMKKAGASVAHIGFALLIIGALISMSKKVTLSKNTAQRKVSGLGKDFDDNKSILLTLGDTLPMGPYLVSYRKKERIGIDVYFEVDYFSPDENGKPKYNFTLKPHVQDNPRMGKAPEPDTKHYLNRDIYTHVTYADLNIDTIANKSNAFGNAKNYVGHMGDTIFSSNALIIIDSLKSNLTRENYLKSDSLIEITALLRAKNVNGETFYARPKYVIQNSIAIPKEDSISALGLKFVFWKINPEEGSVEITMSEKLNNTRDFIVMEAHVFPFINILWIGCLVMAFGTGISILERIRILRMKHD
ncbi:MAG: cytochrome c biogenesis protein CcsA [Bacteroidetes bacterium]|nr:cytochrome c biogenesis protein CcsA [Bacteroidota bacterium]